MKKLRILRLSESSIDERNLQYLGNFPNLQMLELERCRIGSVGLSYIAKSCPNLINLELTGDTHVDDRAIEKIASMKKLAFLSLGGTSVTSAGLMKLKGCTALKAVALPRSNYSASDLREIKKNLPLATLFPTSAKHRIKKTKCSSHPCTKHLLSAPRRRPGFSEPGNAFIAGIELLVMGFR